MDTHELAKTAVTVKPSDRDNENTQMVLVQGRPFCISSPGAMFGYVIEEIEFTLDDMVDAGEEPDLDKATQQVTEKMREQGLDWWGSRGNVWEFC